MKNALHVLQVNKKNMILQRNAARLLISAKYPVGS
jgi:hypothetical protein